ncbi:multiheme c-type cytochrome [Shewanella pealeana]|uniref:Formate-dependent nitrite reductase n=1 Tax=Shewanella pealeana (strain ATCC 700345 / ANG-SQ1) TaxID=398579 RepID=A8H9P0_SHEPA|nr:multiheme c-type cytochrome [Shewanella pealeana]ABV89277.1 formate-dependent nitrite reductase [Shewanella pealeana ATCC 700345]
MSSLFKYSVSLLMSILLVVAASVISIKAVAAEFKINENKQCIMCHKRNGKMLGVHANDALDISCQDCHGEKEGHPRKASNLIGFSNKSASDVNTQTQSCLKCHDHSVLAERDWSHDAHSNKVNCASCHLLHPNTDPVLGVSAKERSELCSSCHVAK